jgi:hypothetical protein
MTWTFQNAREAFHQNSELWDEINTKHGRHILLDSKLIELLIRHFGSQTTLLGQCKDQSNPALVLVNKVRAGIWQTFQPSQAPLGLVIFDKKENIKDQVMELVWNLPGLALEFSILQQDPDFTAFSDMKLDQRIQMVEYIKTARLTVKMTFEDYWEERGKNMTHNLSRQRRRLEDQHTRLSLVTVRDAHQVKYCIEEYGRLESTGWKAKEGTAVTADNRQGMFYRDVLETFCRQGEGVVYQLWFDDKIVASDLCLVRDGMMVMLKTAYDETLKGISPGLLLHQEIFRTVFTEGDIRVIEFYGRVRDWHTKWTDEMRTMYHLNFCRRRWVIGARQVFKHASSLLQRDN